VTVKDDPILNDTVKSISGPGTITIGEEVTLTVDYVASEDRTLAVYLKTTTGTKRLYFYKRITVHAGDELEEVTFTLPEGTPTNATYKYGTYIAPKGKYYKDHLCRVYQHGVKVKDTNTQKPLTRDELIQRIKNWANDPSQANADAITDANTSEITDMSDLFDRGIYHLSEEAMENIQALDIEIPDF